MDNNVGIVYSSVDGHTLKICLKIAAHLEEHGYKTEVCDISAFKGSLSQYSKFVIGASIRYGKHHKEVEKFIKNHKPELDQMDTAFFSVNLVARKSNKNTYRTNPYVIKFFKQQDWKPKIIDVFAVA